jgi:hypothetical protein
MPCLYFSVQKEVTQQKFYGFQRLLIIPFSTSKFIDAMQKIQAEKCTVQVNL